MSEEAHDITTEVAMLVLAAQVHADAIRRWLAEGGDQRLVDSEPIVASMRDLAEATTPLAHHSAMVKDVTPPARMKPQLRVVDNAFTKLMSDAYCQNVLVGKTVICGMAFNVQAIAVSNDKHGQVALGDEAQAKLDSLTGASGLSGRPLKTYRMLGHDFVIHLFPEDAEEPCAPGGGDTLGGAA